MPGVVPYLDEFLITGKDDLDHIRNLESTLKRLHEFGLKVNLSKCKFMQDRVTYLGYSIDKEGLHITEDKVRALLKIPKPTNVSELKTFLGTIAYHARFLHSLSDVAKPLYDLLQIRNSWNWSEDCDNAFERLKSMLTTAPTLAHYDATKDLCLACDASQFGIGAELYHISRDGVEQPIAYISRTLSTSEQHYSQIEREGLAIVWAVRKFHRYLCGRKFKLITDHKPLLAIFGNRTIQSPIAASRMTRWAIILGMYSYDIVYRSTKSHGNADTLSRMPIAGANSEKDAMLSRIDSEIDAIYQDMRQNLVNSLLERIKNSEEIVKLCQILRDGGSLKSDANLRAYGEFISELSIHDGLIYRNRRLVIPFVCRQEYLQELHNGHIGMTKMKALCRERIWWPGLDTDLEKFVRHCLNCQLQANFPKRTRDTVWPESPSVWNRLHLDYAGPFLGFYWLIIVDAWSKWCEIQMLQKATSQETINICKRYFGIYGLPHVLVTDNGPQFSSHEFNEFCMTNNISHVTSPP